mgnify:CR=1 FL=1
MRISEYIHSGFWFVVTPIFPYLRDAAEFLGIVRHSFENGRQPFVIGNLAPNKSAEEFKDYLVSRGFGNHFIAWIDKDEVFGLRYRENYEFQYHIRFFDDGEIRGHYEFTPESHPIKHYKEDFFESRREFFLKSLGDWVLPCSEEKIAMEMKNFQVSAVPEF